MEWNQMKSTFGDYTLAMVEFTSPCLKFIVAHTALSVQQYILQSVHRNLIKLEVEKCRM